MTRIRTLAVRLAASTLGIAVLIVEAAPRLRS